MSENLNLLPKQKASILLATAIITSLGSLVMIVLWHLHIPTVAVFHDKITPMSYSTALGFLLSGIGLFLLWRDHSFATKALGSLLLLLSITALALTFTEQNYSLDHVLQDYRLIGGSHYPVHPLAPQAAICFGLISLVLITNMQALFTGVFGAFAFGLGLVTATGHLVLWESNPNWGVLTQMSLVTAVGFALLGVSLVRLSWIQERVLRAQEYLQVNRQLAAEVQERKQTEEALEQREQQYHAFLQAIPDVMFRIASDGTFLDYWVPETSEFGQSSGAFVGMSIHSFMPGSLTRRMLENLEKALQTNSIQTFEFQWPSASGMLTHEARVTKSGENECIFIMRDITQQLQLSKALSKKNKDLEALLYIISHDLGEPLRALKSFSRILMRRYHDKLDEKGNDLLSRIADTTIQLDQFLKDMLQFSRAQRFELEVAVVESKDLVQNVCERLQDIIKTTDARITQAEKLPKLEVNFTWAVQALYNLLTNAIKYTVPGEPPEVEISGYQQVKPGGTVDVGLVIRDRGIGVPEDCEEYIFKLFHRAAGSEYEGTGAGLAIVKQIAERHGGNAWVQARSGGGSEFYITFGVRSLLQENDKAQQTTTQSRNHS